MQKEPHKQQIAKVQAPETVIINPVHTEIDTENPQTTP